MNAISTTKYLFWIKIYLKSCIKLNKCGSLLTLRHYLLSHSVHMLGTWASYSYLSITITFLTYRRVTYAGATSFLKYTNLPFLHEHDSHNPMIQLSLFRLHLWIHYSPKNERVGHDHIIQWTWGECGVHSSLLT